MVLLGTCLGNTLRTWGTSEGTIGNLWEYQNPKEIKPHTPSKGEKLGHPECMLNNNWLHENSSPKTVCHNFWPGVITLSKSACSIVGLVYRSHPAIANLISLVSIHLVPVQYQHTPICISPKMARDPTSLVLGFEYQSAYQCCTFRVAFSPGINLAIIMCFKLYSFPYFEFAPKSFP